MKEFRTICLGFIVHLILLMNTFDIYYKSPLVHGMTPFGNISNPPAYRLVLFVADGLRAQTFFDRNTKAVFLKNIMRYNGSWGISHSRMPTESRPGHVALAAGFYEDVSAVMKGWRENPVEFDSVFNQSTYTWSWGSPDILPMFAKGISDGHVFTHTYPSHFQDFVSDDASQLDLWVFDNVKKFLNESRLNATLDSMVRREKVVLFLHLLGTDTIGHGFKPKSSTYINNVALVDRGVAEIHQLIERYFNDGRTAYVFTADHGMTDWGSHGAGHEHETLTPLVVWGAGVRRPSSTSLIGANIDVEQIDLAPLMASLIGVNMPLNSLGVLPLRYLNSTDQYKSHAACSNFEAIVEQMLLQRKIKLDTSFRFLFREYSSLTLMKLDAVRRQIGKLLEQKRFTLACSVCLDWIPTAVDGLLYYHRYERPFLCVFVVLTFLSWQFYVWNVIHRQTSTTTSDTNVITRQIILANVKQHKKYVITVGFITFYLFATSQPFMYYVYCLLPFGLLYAGGRDSQMPGSVILSIFGSCSTFCSILALVVGVELLVLSFFYRWALSVGLLYLAIWPLFNASIDRRTKLSWTLICLLNALFPLLPTVGQSVSYGMVSLATFALGLFSFAASSYRNLKTNGVEFRKLFPLNVFAVVSLCCSFVVLLTAVSVEAKRGSPLIARVFSWFCLVASPVLPLFADRTLKNRSISLVTSLFVPFSLMSVSYEPYFLVSFVVLLYLWLCIERKFSTLDDDDGTPEFLARVEFGVVDKDSSSNYSRNVPIQFDDVRRAYFFVFFILLAFFGTGNIASLNSFNPSFIYCFVTIFSPFLMTTLLIIKIVIPFLFVCTALYAWETLCSSSSSFVSTGSLFWLIVMISDFMALNFFFLLKDTGSWLDIGSSISHYVISMITTVVVMLLYAVSKFLTTYSLNDAKRHIL